MGNFSLKSLIKDTSDTPAKLEGGEEFIFGFGSGPGTAPWTRTDTTALILMSPIF